MKQPNQKHKKSPEWGDHALHGRHRRTRPLFMRLEQDSQQRPYRALVGGRSHISTTPQQENGQ